jgi:signal transduction histidine kinase
VFTTGEPFVGRGVRVMLQRDPGGGRDELFLDFVYQPITGTDGAVAGIFVLGYDITGQKRLEAQLGELLERERTARAQAEAASREALDASRLKDEFLATLSHELRTPLNALLGWVHILRTGALTDEARARAVEVIERNARLQAQLVDDILDVSRIVTGKLRLNIGDVDVAAVIGAAIDTVRPAADARGVAIARETREGLVVHADADRLQQVVWNLLTNAVKFTPPGGTVHVSTAVRDGMIETTVQDTGVGIAPGFLAHVFDRFRQAESGINRPHGGLGLGLSIVKHLVEAHGGEVFATSDGPGKGARFTVRLAPASSVQ